MSCKATSQPYLITTEDEILNVRILSLSMFSIRILILLIRSFEILQELCSQQLFLCLQHWSVQLTRSNQSYYTLLLDMPSNTPTMMLKTRRIYLKETKDYISTMYLRRSKTILTSFRLNWRVSRKTSILLHAILSKTMFLTLNKKIAMALCNRIR